MNGDLHDYQKLFDAVSAMVFVITYDGIILAVNRSVMDKLGYSRTELVGQKVISIHPPGSEEKICRILDSLVQAEEALCTLALVAKNGLFIDVETRIYKGSWETVPVLFGFSVDITKQKVSEQKFEAIFTYSPIPIMVSRLADGLIIDVNDAWCRLMGYTREDVAGKTTTEIAVWADPEERDNLVAVLEHTPHILGYPVHLLSANREAIYGLISGTELTINGEAVWITSLVDHTEQKLLEEQIDEIRELTITIALEKLEKQLASNKYIRG